MAAFPAFLNSFFRATESRPARIFWICVAAQVLLWTVIPALTSQNALSDVIEGYAWGHEWPLGTYKHPPLAAWTLEIFALVTGRALWAHFLASQLAVAAAFWAVWQTGRRMVGEVGALIGALLLTGIGYYNLLIPEFNPNVLQLPFWVLIGWSFHRAIKDDRLTDWLLLGVWAAAGLYTKYSTILLLIALGALMLAHPEGRKRFKSKGPWLAMLVGIALFLPHAMWLFRHDFEPLIYAGERFESATAYGAFFALLFGQATVLLPAALIYGVAFGGKREAALRRPSSFDAAFLHTVTFGPLILTALIAVLFGVRIRAMWGAPFWNFIGLWAVFFGRPLLASPALRRFAVMWGVILAAGLAAAAAANIYTPYITHQAGRLYFPGRALATQVSDAWHARYHTPLRYVAGDMWIAGNVAYYAPDHPHVLVDGSFVRSPWVTPEDMRRDGGVIVWCRGDCAYEDTHKDIPVWFWSSVFKNYAEIEPPITLPRQTKAGVTPVIVGWAILPPQGDEKPQ